MKFILRTDRPDIRETAIEAIQELDSALEWDLDISKHSANKTAEQRGWFHALIGIFSREVGVPAGDLKEICKAKVMGWKTVRYGGLELRVADGHSEALTLQQYSDLIEQVYILAGDAGISLPPADRGRHVQE